MKIGLFFGSFNPIHTGHLIVANQVLNATDVTKIWFVLSPQSPFKNSIDLLPDKERLYFLKLAIDSNPKFKVCDIELKLPQPNYTATTLAMLNEKYPQHQFYILMGEDNIGSFHKWKNYAWILDTFKIVVYKRGKVTTQDEIKNHQNVTFLDTALLQISSTWIRRLLAEKKSIKYLVPDCIENELNHCSFYQNK